MYECAAIEKVPNIYDMGGASSGVELRFVQGDLSDEAKLMPIMHSGIDTAVILGSHATEDLPPESCDTRVLSNVGPTAGRGEPAA